MNFIQTTFKRSPVSSILFVLSFVGLVTLNLSSGIGSLQTMNGTFVSHGTNAGGGQIRLDLIGKRESFDGTLTIADASYGITAQQMSLGTVEGQIHLAGDNRAFTLSQSPVTLFLPPRFTSVRLKTESGSYKLLRRGDEQVDLSGEWQSFNGTLQVQRARGDAWIGRLERKDAAPLILEFQRSGLALDVAWRSKGETSTDQGTYRAHGAKALMMTIDGIYYQFRRPKDIKEIGFAHKEMLPRFDGVYRDDGIIVNITVRQKLIDNTTHWICGGYLSGPNDLHPIIACGPEGDQIWLNYRQGSEDDPDFGTAYATLTQSGLDLSGFNGRRQLNRQRTELNEGQYKAGPFQLALFSSSSGDWSGVFMDGTHNFRIEGVKKGDKAEFVREGSNKAYETFTLTAVKDQVIYDDEKGQQIVFFPAPRLTTTP